MPLPDSDSTQTNLTQTGSTQTDSMCVESTHSMQNKRFEAEAQELVRLLNIMTALRDPEQGCPWDLEQTYATIAPYTIEEAYELADAVERGDMLGLQDEAGDLLFQVVYYSQLAREDGLFDFADIARHAADKMIRRHPNVFGNAKTADAEAQIKAWAEIKRAERANKQAKATTQKASALDAIPLALPALIRAAQLSSRAAESGFEWSKLTDVWAKVREEEKELQEAPDHHHQSEEFGDLLFALVNVGRWMGIDPETALRRANDKFERRFRALEKQLSKQNHTDQNHMDQNHTPKQISEMQKIWEQIKQEGSQTADQK